MSDPRHPRQNFPLPKPAPHELGWLKNETERVRFVLRARLGLAGVSQKELIGRLTLLVVKNRREFQRPVTKNQLSRLLTSGDVLANHMELVTKLEQLAIHDNETSRYAIRVRENAGFAVDQRGDPRWWVHTFSNQFRYETPVEVLAAGLSLTRWVDAVGEDFALKQTKGSLALQALVVSLCRIASGDLGYAHDAMTVLARLGPLAADEVSRFIETSPLGVWVARAADGAIRRSKLRSACSPHTADMVEAYFEASRRLRTDINLPSRCMSHLRLYRRLAADGHDEARRQSFDRLTAVAADLSMPSRWRRFALWASAEPAMLEPSRFRGEFEVTCAELRQDPIVADVVQHLEGRGGGPDSSIQRLGPYTRWIAAQVTDRFDLTFIDHRNAHGAFDWELALYPKTDALLRRHTLRGFDGEPPLIASDKRLAAIGPDIRLRVLDILHESLVHPGFIRVQTYIDLLSAAGPNVESTVVSLVSSMVDEVTLRAEVSDHLVSVLDSMLLLLGRTRKLETLPALLHAANWKQPELVASALWSIGDVLAGPRKLSEKLRSVGTFTSSEAHILSAFRDSLQSEHVLVQRAAIHAVAVSRPEQRDLVDLVRELASSSPGVRDWARWCQLLWSDDYLNSPAKSLA